MMLVRPNLTEILLEVTNEEIERIATDAYNKSRQKGQTNNDCYFSDSCILMH